MPQAKALVPLTDGQREEVAKYLWLIEPIAGRWESRQMVFEDCRQQGAIGLAKAVQTFDEAKGERFNYYRKCVQTAIRDAARRASVVVIPHQVWRTLERIPQTNSLAENCELQGPDHDFEDLAAEVAAYLTPQQRKVFVALLAGEPRREALRGVTSKDWKFIQKVVRAVVAGLPTPPKLPSTRPNLPELSRQSGIPLGVLHSRLRLGWPIDRAIATPMRKTRSNGGGAPAT